MPRLLQLVHGYPPREAAGTERYAERVATGLRARGWAVHSLAATREPGAPMYSLREEPGLTRVVNNAPFGGVRRAEQDEAIRRIIERQIDRFRPDLVFVQHPMFLDVGFACEVPLVWMLHDAWGWCAAGGTLLRDGAACAGPGAACAGCTSAWVKDSPRVELALRAAGVGARIVDPARLHRVWKRLPARIRALAEAPGGEVTAAHIGARDQALRAFAARCTLVSPSRWLADEAARQGFSRPIVLPHGVDAGPPRRAPGPFVFVGTLAPHKGPALVHAAARLAGVDLRIHGPVGPDATYAASFPHHGVVDDVPALLAGARALVMGSVWPENAPLVVLEARSAGCPVIAPAIGGLPELVDPGIDGWLYPPGDVGALAAAMRCALVEAPPVREPPTFAAHLNGLLEVFRISADTHRCRKAGP